MSETAKTATRVMKDRYHIDMRRRRADHLLAWIMSEIDGDLHPDADRRRIYDRIWERLHADGVEIISDYTRQEAGLPPRDGQGWTTEELVALERRRLELMYAPFKPTPIHMA